VLSRVAARVVHGYRNVRALDIAVVIVSYRSAELVVQCLRSVLAERSTPGLHIRVAVVDNASGDFPAISAAIAHEHWSSWATVVAAPRNGGFAYGCNVGISCAFSVATPDYVYLLNPDTQVRPGAIGALVDFLEAHRSVGIAGSGIELPDGTDWSLAFRFPGLLSELNDGLQVGLASNLLRRWVVARVMSNTPECVDWVCGASMMIRTAVLYAIGGLDENYFLYFEETDFCYRAKRAGFPTWYVPDSHVVHLRGGSTDIPDLSISPNRLPPYWFESRRRYFAVTFGVGYAVATDLVAVVAHSLGSVKRFLLGRRRSAIPHFVRDLLRHSVLWSRNRRIAPPRCFSPQS